MKICVLIKQVASEDSPIKLNDSQLGIIQTGLNLITNEPDSYALEEGLQIKEETNGEVVVCTMGAESSHQVIKDALAKGADRALHVISENVEQLAPLDIANIIANKIKDEKYIKFYFKKNTKTDYFIFQIMDIVLQRNKDILRIKYHLTCINTESFFHAKNPCAYRKLSRSNA